MEAFSLLYWKGGGGGGSAASSSLRSSDEPAGTEANIIITSASETDSEDEAEDEGSFFDLELAVPEEDEETEGNREVSDDAEEPSGGDADGGREGGDSDATDGGDEIKFTFSSCSSGDGRAADPDLALSPSDDLFFKGRLVAVEPPSSNGAEHNTSSKAPAALLSASLLKSATKFRVFMLGLKKSKSNRAKPEKSEANSGSGDGDGDKQKPPPPQQKNTLTVKLKVEEVPIISVFTRDNSSRHSSSSASSSSSSSSSSSKKQNGDELAVSDEKRFVMMHKYLKKVKPLYIRVSRRYGEKLRLSGQLSFGFGAPAKGTDSPGKSRKPPGSININIPAGLKVVKKHLGKSRSSSSATPPANTVAATAEKSGRRDDSLLQQQDGIQSAILHCKRSLKSSRDGESPVLPRSASK